MTTRKDRSVQKDVARAFFHESFFNCSVSHQPVTDMTLILCGQQIFNLGIYVVICQKYYPQFEL